MEFKVLPETAKYEKDAAGLWENMSEDNSFMTRAIDSAETLKVVGVLRPTEDNQGTTMYGGVLYRSDLMEHVIDQVASSDVVAAQKDAPETDVFTGYPFESGEDDGPLTMVGIQDMLTKMPEAQAQQIQAYMAQMQAAGMSEDEIVAAFEKQKAQQAKNSTYEGNLEKLGVSDVETPFTISLYPRDFQAKEKVDQIISDRNKAMEDTGKDDQVIHYTDIVGAMMSSVTSIVNSITYILVAFVAISLVVSSIMIGIITYISVLERTKEIGILRSIGASKKDVSRVFNAETFIIGLVAGVLGIGVTALLNIPINMIIEAVAGVANMASVPVGAGGTLIVISVLLTLIGGLIPAKMAAKKDPVTALRTE